MAHDATAKTAGLGGLHALEGEGHPASAPVFPSLIQAATLEFHASLQLLAERARFLTGASGVAIAIEDGGTYVYCASTGSHVPETGSPADLNREVVRKCIAPGEAAGHAAGPADELPAVLAIPIVRNQKVCGFFELATEDAGSNTRNLQVVSPLAEMINTALDHLQAAEQAEKRILDPGLEKPPGPALWHAPQEGPTAPAIPAKPEPPPLSDANPQFCNSCGFPVSPGRSVCLDCENLPASSATIRDLFASEKQESWIAAHGYTVASLLVTALAVAIILWLR